MSENIAFKNLQPVISIRVFNLDLKGMPPTFDRLMTLLDIIKAARYNAFMVEWEDMFPWNTDIRFRSRFAYTPKQIRCLCRAAEERDIDIVPLVQSLGHMETPLSVEGYESLRELKNRTDTLNPLAEGARNLVENMIDDVLELCPNVKYFHLGGDEAWAFGKNLETKEYIKAHGAGALFLHHILPLTEKLNHLGIRPLLWADMMKDWDSDSLRKLAAHADICIWGYEDLHFSEPRSHCFEKHLDRYSECGISMWGTGAYKGVEYASSDLPNYQARQENAIRWVDLAKMYSLKGIIATGWSRYGRNRLQCEPIDAAIDSMINFGIILYEGQPPKGGIENCLKHILSDENHKRFDSCKDVMSRTSTHRNYAWSYVKLLREQIAFIENNPKRIGCGAGEQILSWLAEQITKLEELAKEGYTTWNGLVPEIWIKSYFDERIIPLQNEYHEIKDKLNLLGESCGLIA